MLALTGTAEASSTVRVFDGVTLLVPIFGTIWGVLFLGEPVTPGRIAGCAIILAGCALILGLVRLPIRRPAS